jgi:hypothetical protein
MERSASVAGPRPWTVPNAALAKSGRVMLSCEPVVHTSCTRRRWPGIVDEPLVRGFASHHNGRIVMVDPSSARLRGRDHASSQVAERGARPRLKISPENLTKAAKASSMTRLLLASLRSDALFPDFVAPGDVATNDDGQCPGRAVVTSDTLNLVIALADSDWCHGPRRSGVASNMN